MKGELTLKEISFRPEIPSWTEIRVPEIPPLEFDIPARYAQGNDAYQIRKSYYVDGWVFDVQVTVHQETFKALGASKDGELQHVTQYIEVVDRVKALPAGGKAKQAVEHGRIPKGDTYALIVIHGGVHIHF
jgi:hypothetical protein